MSGTHQTAKTLYVEKDSIKYAYRRFGAETGVPVLFLIHFRGTMDYWDPLLVNSIAKTRPVILFDNAGVGQSVGDVADTIEGMAGHAIALLGAIGVEQADVLGFSMGGYIAPLVALNGGKGLVRKVVIAGSGPSYGEGLAEQPLERTRKVGEWAGQAEPDYENCFSGLFFDPHEESQAAGRAWWSRIHERDEKSSGEKRSELVSLGYKDGGKGIKAMLAAGGSFLDPEQRYLLDMHQIMIAQESQLTSMVGNMAASIGCPSWTSQSSLGRVAMTS
jgi:pimeloyl-ACP methyl ester carboxylesterase